MEVKISNRLTKIQHQINQDSAPNGSGFQHRIEVTGRL